MSDAMRDRLTTILEGRYVVDMDHRCPPGRRRRDARGGGRQPRRAVAVGSRERPRHAADRARFRRPRTPSARRNHPLFDREGSRLVYMVLQPRWCDIVVRDLTTDVERVAVRTARGRVCPQLLQWPRVSRLAQAMAVTLRGRRALPEAGPAAAPRPARPSRDRSGLRPSGRAGARGPCREMT